MCISFVCISYALCVLENGGSWGGLGVLECYTVLVACYRLTKGYAYVPPVTLLTNAAGYFGPVGICCRLIQVRRGMFGLSLGIKEDDAV